MVTMRVPSLTALLLGGLFAIGLAAPARAQTTGQVMGSVTDPQDKAVPGATVTATSPNLQGERNAVTDSTGGYILSSLPPGTYTIKAALSGFQPAQQDNVTVSLGKTFTLNLKLSVGGVSST
jgi:Protocatechuate 3,4-dioxygenase beta subunit